MKRITPVVLLLVLAYSVALADPIWVGSRGGACGFSMGIDSAGRICIAGGSVGIPEDIVVVKYDADGNRLWETVYDTPGHWRDNCSFPGMAVSEDGRVYITGYTHSTDRQFMLTLCLDSLGDLQWVRQYITPDSGACEGVVLRMDQNGNLLVAGKTSGNDYDITLFCMDTAGTTLWTSTFSGPGEGFDQPWDMVTDNQGNIYICGESESIPSSGGDCLVLKFDAVGELQWDRWYHGPGHRENQLTAVRVDESYNVYVAGTAWQEGFEADIVTIKYDSAGNRLWLREYDGPAGSFDGCPFMDLSPSGDALVWGYSWNDVTGHDRDVVLIKYNPAGDTVWTRRFGYHAEGTEARAVCVDIAGNSYVTAMLVMESGTDYASGWLTAIVDNAGVLAWSHEYVQGGHDLARPYSLLLDARGDIYVGGSYFDSQVVLKYADPVGGIGGDVTEVVPEPSAAAVVANGQLRIAGTDGAVLFNQSGRMALQLKAGENDIRHLSPGVYFVVPESGRGIRKVVVLD